MHHWEVRNEPTVFILECDDQVDQLDRTIVIQVFRVIQESLTNIIRHAEASQVRISLQIKPDPDTLLLSISDDGQGCDLDQLNSGFGLRGMEERIKLLGGHFKIHSEANKGMKITAQVPLHEQ